MKDDIFEYNKQMSDGFNKMVVEPLREWLNGENMNNSEVFHDAFIKMINFAREHLSKEQFDEYIYAMYTYGIENVFIKEIPVYENEEYNGCVVCKHIKRIKYAIGYHIKADAVPKGTGTKEV